MKDGYHYHFITFAAADHPCTAVDSQRGILQWGMQRLFKRL